MKKLLLVCAALAFAASPALAQETKVQETETTAALKAPVVQKVEATKDGKLVGKVFTEVDGKKQPIDAKITLSSDGKVLESVMAENGVFSFSNATPGAYTITGSAVGFTGGQAFEVAPYSSGGMSSVDLGLQSVDTGCGSSVVYDAPVAASSCGSCGGGGGGFGGGGGIGGSRRLLRLGLIGGVVAIAVSGDDDDTVVSPDGA